MSRPTLQTTGGKEPYKYNTTQTTQYDMSPPTLQTIGGKDTYKYNTTQTTQYDINSTTLQTTGAKTHTSTTQHKQHNTT